MRQSRMRLSGAAGLLLVLEVAASGQVWAAPLAAVMKNQASLDFPNSITFQIGFAAADNIASVVLEYGDQEQTCGTVVAKAYPEFMPGTGVQAEWVWDMRQSGSLPPGARVWWRWRYSDATGHETVTEQKVITWLDQAHPWQSLSKGDIRLHWYGNDLSFAQQLRDTAYNGLSRVETYAGLSNDQPIDLYIYANSRDMQDAILYEPSWTGGEAFPPQNIVIIGIAPSELSWGQKAEVHELTHVLVGHFTFSCLGEVPTWLNEGLAVYSEGELDPASKSQLDDAIGSDTLLTVRSLSGPFSEVPSKANLSYSESYSLVSFLLDRYGRGKMNALLLALRDGNTVDEAPMTVYGFNIDGLEDQWRDSIGATPHSNASQATPLPSPTMVPTIVPISGALLAITPTPFSVPTPAPTQSLPSGPPLSLTVMMIFTCCALGLVAGVFIVGFILAAQNRKRGPDETDP